MPRSSDARGELRTELLLWLLGVVAGAAIDDLVTLLLSLSADFVWDHRPW